MYQGLTFTFLLPLKHYHEPGTKGKTCIPEESATVNGAETQAVKAEILSRNYQSGQSITCGSVPHFRGLWP